MKSLQVFLHPRRASQRIAALEKEIADAQEDCKQARLQGQQQAETLREEVAQARGEVSRTAEQLKELQTKYESLKQQATNEMQRHASLFTDRQNDIEKLKAGYERRLEHLRHALADAHALLADRRDYDALRQMSIIDMTQKQQPSPVRKPAEKPLAKPIDKLSDWLEPLPD